MNFNQLEVFCLVAQVKSFSKAAKLAHLTQPAISSQIQSLESNLNVTLFTRTNTGVHLTEAGKVAHHYIKKMLQLQEELGKDLTLLKEGKLANQ
ncbi:LysR family transcriptional regulator [Heliorestis acidaminivorans]|nr:LysR family transcriptional regulator [Heliorestis acidaminivorans]